MLQFVNPLMLIGAAVASAPIIIHLLNRRRFKVVTWAAMEFLLASSHKNFRRVRLQEIILLVLRTLVLLLVAAAMARPFLAGAAGVLGKSQRYVVIVVDNSFSMGYTVGGERPLDKAVQFADKTLDTLNKGDMVSLVAVSERARAIIREPSVDIATVRSELKDLPPGHGSTNLPDAFRVALDLLRQSKLAQKELYLITDNQRSGWRLAGGKGFADGKGSQLSGLIREINAIAEFTLADVGLPSHENVAVTEFKSRDRILAREIADTTFSAQITNFGENDLNNVEVSFEVDGFRQGSTSVSIKGGTSASVSFSYTFHESLPHSLAVRLKPDRLTPDDARFLAVEVVDSAKVLVVDGKPSADLYQSATGYLQTALSPRAESFARPTIFEPVVIQPGELATTKLADYEFVVLADVPRIDPSIIADIEEYVRAGGAVVIFPGSGVDLENYNKVLYIDGLGMLPARLAGIQGDPAKAKFVSLAVPPDSTHPLLKEFTRQKAAFLNLPQFYQYAALDVPDRDDTTVIFRFEKGRPGLVEKRIGRGKVLLFAFTANDAWTDLPRRPGFLLLMHEMAAYVARDRQSAANLIVGDMLAKDAEPEALVSRITVSGPAKPIDIVATPAGKRARIRFENTDQAGIYEMRMQRDDRVKQDYFSVNVDPAESDLHRIGQAELRRALPEANFRYLIAASALGDSITASLNKSDLWKNLLLAALVLMCVESILAQRFGR